jgi:hypothetical protein
MRRSCSRRCSEPASHTGALATAKAHKTGLPPSWGIETATWSARCQRATPTCRPNKTAEIGLLPSLKINARPSLWGTALGLPRTRMRAQHTLASCQADTQIIMSVNREEVWQRMHCHARTCAACCPASSGRVATVTLTAGATGCACASPSCACRAGGTKCAAEVRACHSLLLIVCLHVPHGCLPKQRADNGMQLQAFESGKQEGHVAFCRLQHTRTPRTPAVPGYARAKSTGGHTAQGGSSDRVQNATSKRDYRTAQDTPATHFLCFSFSFLCFLSFLPRFLRSASASSLKKASQS